MRRPEKEVLDRDEIDGYIIQARICRVGFEDRGDVYIVPMNFGYSGGSLYFHSAKEGRKIDLIKRNGKASFEIDIDLGLVTNKDAFKCTNHFISVMGSGRIEVLEDEAERTKGLRALMDHYTTDMYVMSDRCLMKTAVIRLSVDKISCKKNPAVRQSP